VLTNKDESSSTIDDFLIFLDNQKIFVSLLELLANNKKENIVKDSLEVFRIFFQISSEEMLYGWLTDNTHCVGILVELLSCDSTADVNLILLVLLNRILYLGEITVMPGEEGLDEAGKKSHSGTTSNQFKRYIMSQPVLTEKFERIQMHKDDNVFSLVEIILNKYFNSDELDTF
jgi:hypothetical protein